MCSNRTKILGNIFTQFTGRAQYVTWTFFVLENSNFKTSYFRLFLLKIADYRQLLTLTKLISPQTYFHQFSFYRLSQYTPSCLYTFLRLVMSYLPDLRSCQMVKIPAISRTITKSNFKGSFWWDLKIESVTCDFCFNVFF